MADKPTQGITAKDSADLTTKAVGEIQQNALESLNWFGSAWLETWSAMGSEVSEFIAERIQEDIKTQHAMLKCKNPAELSAVQTAFVQKAIEQYTEETGKLVSLQQGFLDRLSKAKPT